MVGHGCFYVGSVFLLWVGLKLAGIWLFFASSRAPGG